MHRLGPMKNILLASKKKSLKMRGSLLKKLQLVNLLISNSLIRWLLRMKKQSKKQNKRELRSLPKLRIAPISKLKRLRPLSLRKQKKWPAKRLKELRLRCKQPNKKLRHSETKLSRKKLKMLKKRQLS